MIEDQDRSKKNIQQLVRAGFPGFLDSYLLNHLYDDGTAEQQSWPVMSERNALALALAWNLSSESSISREDPQTRREMIRLLQPIVFGASRYSIFRIPEDVFDPNNAPHGLLSCSEQREIKYFGTVERKACIPSGTLFASLLYFTRTEQTTIQIPPHLTCKTRSEANLLGWEGPCVDDIHHFAAHCRTHFAKFPPIDVETSTCNPSDPSEGVILGQTSYKLGTLNGPWQGSNVLTSLEEYAERRVHSKLAETSSVQARKPLYFIFQEHFCYDPNAIVPPDDATNGMKNAWLPDDLQVTETQGGINFSDANGTFHTHYETFHHGQNLIKDQRQLVDVIITGKTDDRYSMPWGPSSTILGRVRLADGLIILRKTSYQWGLETQTDRQMFRGYVTSSQNFVGRIKGGAESSCWEGVFSLNKS